MDIQEFMDKVFRAQFETKEEWFAFKDEVYAKFNQMSESNKQIIIEDNTLEMLSMVISAYEYEEQKKREVRQ